jgi:hypothetical protein
MLVAEGPAVQVVPRRPAGSTLIKSYVQGIQCPTRPVARLNFYKRHVLADSGINLIHQRTIAVERFAVLDFHRFLPNARLQSGVLDIVDRSSL